MYITVTIVLSSRQVSHNSNCANEVLLNTVVLNQNVESEVLHCSPRVIFAVLPQWRKLKMPWIPGRYTCMHNIVCYIALYIYCIVCHFILLWKGHFIKLVSSHSNLHCLFSFLNLLTWILRHWMSKIYMYSKYFHYVPLRLDTCSLTT